MRTRIQCTVLVLLGGVCLTQGETIHRIADDVPASPIAVVPETPLGLLRCWLPN